MNYSGSTTTEDKALLVSKYFAWKNQQNPVPAGLDKLKLQKLLYYAQAWSLVLNKKPLFNNKIEAWVHGPAVPDVWRFFKGVDLDILTSEEIGNASSMFNTKEKEVMDEVWRVYGKYDGVYLEALTHSELPWQEARKGVPEYESSNNEISQAVMQEYYTRLYEHALAKTPEETNA